MNIINEIINRLNKMFNISQITYILTNISIKQILTRVHTTLDLKAPYKGNSNLKYKL
jgi:hypothetical protein